MSSISPKHALFTEFAYGAKAIAHEHRLELLELVAQGEMSIETRSERTGLSLETPPNSSQHLRRAGLALVKAMQELAARISAWWIA